MNDHFSEDASVTGREQLSKLNCWEYMNCGRQPSGALVGHFGVCPASVETALYGVHGGRNAGRACWAVAGSSSGRSKTECFFARVHKGCENCDFYHTVRAEEGASFLEREDLLRKTEPV